MGMFGDLFGSSSHSQQTTSTSKVTNTQLAGGNIDAPTIYGSGNRQTVNVTTVDPGAIKAAVDISRSAQILGAGAIAAGGAVAIAGLDTAQHAYAGSLDFAGATQRNAFDYASAAQRGSFSLVSDVAGQAIAQSGYASDRVARFATTTLDTNTGLAVKAINSVSDAGAGVLTWASNIFTDALAGQRRLTDQNITAVSGLAQQVSQSATQSTNQAVEKIVMTLAIAAAAIMIFKTK